MSLDREHWLQWLATTCYCLGIRPDYLYYDGYCTEYDVLDVKLRMKLKSNTKKTQTIKTIDVVQLKLDL